NTGPSDAPGTNVSDLFPSTITSATWTSTASGGATGNTTSGSGDINDVVDMPVGSSITYTVTATIDPSATGTLDNTATVTTAQGVTDTNLANNSATDSDALTPQVDVGVTKDDFTSTSVPGLSTTYTIVATNTGPRS